MRVKCEQAVLEGVSVAGGCHMLLLELQGASLSFPEAFWALIDLSNY
jgi:hypothetical protein